MSAALLCFVVAASGNKAH